MKGFIISIVTVAVFAGFLIWGALAFQRNVVDVIARALTIG